MYKLKKKNASCPAMLLEAVVTYFAVWDRHGFLCELPAWGFRVGEIHSVIVLAIQEQWIPPVVTIWEVSESPAGHCQTSFHFSTVFPNRMVLAAQQSFCCLKPWSFRAENSEVVDTLQDSWVEFYTPNPKPKPEISLCPNLQLLERRALLGCAVTSACKRQAQQLLP